MIRRKCKHPLSQVVALPRDNDRFQKGICIKCDKSVVCLVDVHADARWVEYIEGHEGLIYIVNDEKGLVYRLPVLAKGDTPTEAEKFVRRFREGR